MGLGTQFPEQERPPTHATQMRNRFINPGGGLEKRQALVTAATLVSGPNFSWAEEFVRPRGTAQTVLAGGSAIYIIDSSVGTTITTAHTGLNASAGNVRMAQSDDDLIIVNGQDRNLFTTDLLKFREMRPIIESFDSQQTAASTAHDRTEAATSDFANFLTQTNIVINDLIFDAQTSAYALVTKVSSESIEHTALTAGSPGLASGNAAKGTGDFVEFHDLHELNIIPVSSQGGGIEFDNVALGETGTSAKKIKVSSILWSNTDVRIGDYVSNTTRNQVCRIDGISVSSLDVTKVCAQSSGDALVFLKSAMPIAADVHVHYGRTYYLDARDRRKIRISGPLDPQDLTTNTGTLDSSTFKLGSQQPVGDEMVAMTSFQQYLAIAGRRHILLYQGTDPIADTSAVTDQVDFNPQALFPVGVASPDSLLTIGNDLIWLGKQGMDSAALRGSDTLPTQEHMSEGIRNEIQQAVSGVDDSKIKVFNYPKRQWVICKVSSDIFVFNYSPNLAESFQRANNIASQTRVGSWSRFDGQAAEQNHYLVKSNQKIVAAGNSGQFYDFDVPNTYADGAGSAYSTTYQTSWLGLDETKGIGRPSRKQKAGIALQPQNDTSAAVTYTISATAPYSGQSNEQITVEMSGDSDTSIPLRWRGERVRLTFETSGGEGPDILTSYTVVYNKYGVT